VPDVDFSRSISTARYPYAHADRPRSNWRVRFITQGEFSAVPIRKPIISIIFWVVEPQASTETQQRIHCQSYSPHRPQLKNLLNDGKYNSTPSHNFASHYWSVDSTTDSRLSSIRSEGYVWNNSRPISFLSSLLCPCFTSDALVLRSIASSWSEHRIYTR
jgi:hypothetical protein